MVFVFEGEVEGAFQLTILALDDGTLGTDTLPTWPLLLFVFVVDYGLSIDGSVAFGVLTLVVERST